MFRQIRWSFPSSVLVTVVVAVVVCLPGLSAQELPGAADNWHQWRGPTGNGQAAAVASPPLTWSETEHVLWKRDLPGEGSSTPIIWGDQVFVLSAVSTGRAAESPVVPHPDAKTLPPNVYYQFVITSVDRRTGEIRWQKTATEQIPHEGKHSTHTYAAASPVTDGKRLYASFGSRGIYCYTPDGNLLWQKDPGDMRTRFAWGEAVTPALAGELLIVNWDQEEDSFIVALRADSGEEVWRRERPEEKTSWNTPLITEYKGRLMAVVNGSGKARAYDVQTGDVLWECAGQTTNAIPSPLRFGDAAICMSGYRGAASFAIPLDSVGDISGTDRILWSYPQGTPYVPSPSASGNRLYFTAGTGDILTVLDMSTGKAIADKIRLSGVGNCYASPLVAGGRVYIIGREGGAVVLKDEAPFETLSRNSLEGNFDASPVAIGGQLFLRSWNRLYCISE
jgi:outer membrane protein assembly factor BamB